MISRLEIPQQQLVARRIVVSRLRPSATIFRHVRRTQPKAVCLHRPIAAAIRRQARHLNPRQQARTGVARLHVWVDRFQEPVILVIKLRLHAVNRFPVHTVRFTANKERHPRRRHEIAFVGGIDEHLARERAARLHRDRMNAATGLHHAMLPVESLVHHRLNVRLGQHLTVNLHGNVRLERPHRLVIVAAARVMCLKLPPSLACPCRVIPVILPNAMIELPRQPADGRLVADIGRPEPARRQSAKMTGWLNQNNAFTHPMSLHSRDNTRRSTAIHNNVGDLRRSGLWRSRSAKAPCSND